MVLKFSALFIHTKRGCGCHFYGIPVLLALFLCGRGRGWPRETPCHAHGHCRPLLGIPAPHGTDLSRAPQTRETRPSQRKIPAMPPVVWWSVAVGYVAQPSRPATAQRPPLPSTGTLHTHHTPHARWPPQPRSAPVRVGNAPGQAPCMTQETSHSHCNCLWCWLTIEVTIQ